MMTRRDFLGTAALSLLGGPAAAAERRKPVVDTHVHCFAGKADTRFPYHPQGPYQPEHAATPQDLVKAMDAAGVDYAVIVHPEPYQDDHRYQEYCLKIDPKRLKGTCLFFADKPGAVAAMKELAARLPIVTARIHAYDSKRLPPFGKPELRALWKQAADLGLAVQLHIEPPYAAGFDPYIKEFSATPVIIDHLGWPFKGTPKQYDTVVSWWRYKNTVMKLSGLGDARMKSDEPIALTLKRVVAAWGPERLIYGGGWQGDAAGKGYRAERERLVSLLTGLSPAERAQVLGGNAARLFHFGA
jgi:predicted TIM-barrel fold metal-dependent hydrolase